jgi:hypothetical protein
VGDRSTTPNDAQLVHPLVVEPTERTKAQDMPAAKPITNASTESSASSSNTTGPTRGLPSGLPRFEDEELVESVTDLKLEELPRAIGPVRLTVSVN